MHEKEDKIRQTEDKDADNNSVIDNVCFIKYDRDRAQ